MKKVFKMLKNIFFFLVCFVIILVVIFSVENKNKKIELNKSLKQTEEIVNSNHKNNSVDKDIVTDLKEEYKNTDLTIVKSIIVKNEDNLQFKTIDFLIEKKNNNIEINKQYVIDVDKLKEREDYSDLDIIKLMSYSKGDTVYISLVSPTIIKNNNQISNTNVVRIDDNFKINKKRTN